MYQKRKKFTEEATPEKRRSDRWEQQVFFIRRKFPHAEPGISKIVNNHTKEKGTKFVPSEEALSDLANFYSDLQGPN